MMKEEPITVADITFLINRLLTALDKFSAQISENHALFLVGERPKKESKADQEVRKVLSNLASFKHIDPEARERLTNPTSTEFFEFKRDYSRNLRETKRINEERHIAETNAMKRISVLPTEDIGIFDLSKLQTGMVVAARRHEYSSDTVGIICNVDIEMPFPLSIHVAKRNFGLGKRIYVVELEKCISAIVDPSLMANALTPELILLAIKHSTAFEGLIYLRPYN